MTEDSLRDKTAVLPPLLCAPIAHYVVARACAGSTVNWGLRFEKRFKDTHRLAIADTRGRLELTVPIAKPNNRHCAWEEIRLSDHGRWWDIHRIALESAYGRTPFFEFYIDRLLPMLTEGVVDRYVTLRSLSEAWDTWIRSTLMLPAPLDYSSIAESDRLVIPAEESLAITTPPYWQVRADKIGFIPGLSVLDLIFNLGPEAVIYIDRLAERFHIE